MCAKALIPSHSLGCLAFAWVLALNLPHAFQHARFTCLVVRLHLAHFPIHDGAHAGLLRPADTVMDLNIGAALWLAAQGEGPVRFTSTGRPATSAPASGACCHV